ncbi:MAG: alpha/beta fold hydrolase [Burkholderiales bacterium]|nr:alpha/beta fold hydrolase [Burkholderiales bacterium]
MTRLSGGSPKRMQTSKVSSVSGGGVTDSCNCRANLESWLTDFDIDTVDVPGSGKFHSGFWRAWQAISVDVLAAIDGHPVILVGHSLGAALAIAAALEMTISGNPPASVFGFEPPRVSPDVGVCAQLANVSVNLYRNGIDIVPTVPPDWPDAAILNPIGKPALPFPNTVDHEIGRVIAASPMAQAATA